MYLPHIVELLQDTDPSVHSAAVSALSNMGEAAKDYVPQISELLKDQHTNVRSSAVETLGHMGDAAKDYVPQVAELLKNPIQSIRNAAASALGNMGEGAKNYVIQIEELLKYPDASTRSVAAYTLVRIGRVDKDRVLQISKLLKHSDSNVRNGALKALADMGEAAKDYVPQIIELLKDPDPGARINAVRTLGDMGESSKDYVSQITELLNDPDPNIRSITISTLSKIGMLDRHHVPNIAELLKIQTWGIRNTAVSALSNIGPIEVEGILYVLSPIYENSLWIAQLRFLAHFVGGGEEETEILIRWLGLPNDYPETLPKDEGVETLKVFEKAWALSSSFPRLRDDLEKQIAVVSEKAIWEPTDLPSLRRHASNLKSAKSTQAASVQKTISSLERKQSIKWWSLRIGSFICAHLAFWGILIFFYPKSTRIQAIFFWNKWVRYIAGFGYVHLLLTWLPYLRMKLFAPFRKSLLSDAALETFDPESYFEDSEVKNGLSGQVRPIKEVIPEIKGQIVLVGESGLGKTMFIRHLVIDSKQIVVYLPAEKCSNGVIEAIQAKLQGTAKDHDFLSSLIYTRAIDVCIDGLNEVTPDTRATITNFVQNNPKANVIITTQPIEWVPPSIAKVYEMQPLRRDQIEHFLITRKHILPNDATVSRMEYEEACSNYLSKALNEKQPEAILISARRILSNPMDLTIVAQMLARGQEPDLFHLQDQQYKIMAAEYDRVNLNPFPLGRFSERVYKMTLNDEFALPEEDFLNELECMQRHKMVVTRQSVDAQWNRTKRWYFRHDKIMDLFIVQTFLGVSNDKPQKHMGDSRFRGVYLLLVFLLPEDEARNLGLYLATCAADTRDHTISDAFLQLLASRKTE